jgi:hypothetical protein
VLPGKIVWLLGNGLHEFLIKVLAGTLRPMTMNFDLLRMNDWGRVALSDRERLAVELSEHLRRTRADLEYVGLQAVGESNAADSAVPVWRDATGQGRWVLVPGAEFRPGYSPQALERLRQQVALCEDADDGPTDEWYEKLAAGPPVRVDPFLMLALPVLQSLPGISAMIRVQEPRLRQFDPRRHTPLALHESELMQVMTQNRWDLPTVQEMEWALRGGREALFPWGDELPWWEQLTNESAKRIYALAGSRKPDLVEETLDRLFEERFPDDYATEVPEWRRANPFGIVDGNVCGCWARDGDQLSCCGGAADFYPWQGPLQWTYFLTTESRAVRKDRPNPFKRGTFIVESHAIRPVIRIVGERASGSHGGGTSR